jgi:hypothetical protein
MPASGLQRAAGNQATLRLLRSDTLAQIALQESAPGPIQRQPASTTAARPQQSDYRDFVLTTITAFKDAASFYSDPTVPISRSLFDRLVSTWQDMVVKQEGVIDTDLGGNAKLKADLRAAYMAAIRVLLTRAAAALRQTETDLLREKRGQIPMWAWPAPHHIVPGISTPIAEGLTPNRQGDVTFSTNGVEVTIRPDRTKRGLRDRAHTEVGLVFSTPGATFAGARPHPVKRIDRIPPPELTIRTEFQRGVRATAQSAYGRGTTAADVAGGALDPQSKTLGFHEGSHGLDAVDFITTHPPPVFAGAVGMTKAEFDAAKRQFSADVKAYNDALSAFLTSQGDCVGTTIDEFHQREQAALPRRKRRRIVLECVP